MRHIRFPLVLLAAAVIAVLALGGSPAESAFPGVNGLIAFNRCPTGGDCDIYVMQADGGGEQRLTTSAFNPYPAWSPDGSKIAFHSLADGNEEVYVMDADGGNKTKLTDSGAEEPAWSPDGSRIAFIRFPGVAGEIYVMDADGGNQQRLTNNFAQDWFPAWSPDGSKIAFQSKRDGDWRIYVMDADGDNQTRLTNTLSVNPNWSPDGTKIAFSNFGDGDGEIYVMDADGDNQQRLTNNLARDDRPAWSPDGSKIAFDSDRHDAWGEIYVMDADGGNQTRLTNNPGYVLGPDWQPVAAGGTNTVPHPEGQNKEVDLGSGVKLTCANVPQGGGGESTLKTGTSGAKEPFYQIVPGLGGQILYYDITTTANCEPPIKICIKYDHTKLISAETALRLRKHISANNWKDVTKGPPPNPNTVDHIICGEVDSLSVFAMMEPGPVGGIVNISADSGSPAEASGGSGADYALLAAALAAGAALVALAAGGWYARRRVR